MANRANSRHSTDRVNSQDSRGFALNLEEIKALQGQIVGSGIEDFLALCPDSMVDDGFIQGHDMKFVVKKYGQDISFGRDANRAAEMAVLDAGVDYRYVSSMSLAIACHLR
jgi:hypothetical protein